MKKLMIALAAVAMAAGVQAATTNWKFNLGSTVVKDGYKLAVDDQYDPVAMSGATVYLINYASYSQDDILTAFNGNNFDISKYVLKGADGTVVKKDTNDQGKIPAASSVTFTMNKADDADPGDTPLSAFIAVLAKDENGKNYIYLSETQTKPDVLPPNPQTIQPSAALSAEFIGAEKTFSDAGWYAAVPEPTSGLLLLLGVAGLALKRKRA